ncbi:MAG: DNA replication and repair protein RecF [Muribaculaceae bacterium]|nr:DNA replication and repair protein RecF [Muribaculaceae bacterium]MDE6755283.1 DNA replication and repair protein RecF [Muribaculaceae bacterium]
MILKNIDILNFKNIAAATLDFSPGVNCLLGMNGMGKSNLLEAIHFLSMVRPMSPVTDNALIKHGEDMLIVKGEFVSDAGNADSIACGINKGKGKSLKRNGKEYQRFSEHIGRYPIVTVTPGDSQLISGPAEDRRKLMDMVISQAHPEYLSALIRYNRSLESRNRMLRAGVRDALLFESVEAPMEEAAEIIFATRAEWVKKIAPKIENCYARLSGNRESSEIEYRSQLAGSSLKEILAERRDKDIVLGYTSGGVHRDDLETHLDGYSLRRLGSQGQVKTFTVALRLAIFDYLKEAKGMTPLLLLDDIFDKLDAERVERIMKEVSSSEIFGQIFITDTNRKHLDDILAGMEGDHILLNVSEGNFKVIG